jgi:hypothetical protein
MNTDANDTDSYLAGLPAWQQQNLAQFRSLIHKASLDITEEIKWGVPVFLVNGKIVFSMASFKAHTKYNFIQNGATLDDKHKLFNNGLESKKSRSIDLQEGQNINQVALEDLVLQAISKL